MKGKNENERHQVFYALIICLLIKVFAFTNTCSFPYFINFSLQFRHSFNTFKKGVHFSTKSWHKKNL